MNFNDHYLMTFANVSDVVEALCILHPIHVFKLSKNDFGVDCHVCFSDGYQLSASYDVHSICHFLLLVRNIVTDL
jgi:hypothetical protein